MKKFFEDLLTLIVGGVGCLVYAAIWGLGFIFCIWLALTILRFIF